MNYLKPDGFTGEAYIETLDNRCERDPFALMLGSFAVGIERSRHAADMLAESYRLFGVGGVGYAYDIEHDRTAMISSANLKLRLDEDEIDEYDVESIPKICAEMNIVRAAEEAGYTRIMGMIVAGTSDPKKIYAVTYRETDTLHPCGDCRNVFHHSSLIDDNTQIVTVGSVKNRFQSQTYRQLKARYKRPVDQFEDAPPSARFDTLLWHKRYERYIADREELGLSSPEQHSGDISRSRARILLARRVMETTFS